MIEPPTAQDPLKYIIGDCLELMPQVPPETVDLVIADPPYNIGKDEWDHINNYIVWSMDWIKKAEAVLKDNGSLYIFHNDFMTMAQLAINIQISTGLKFRQLIVWNKRFKEASNYGYLNGYVQTPGLRNYQKMAEYILFYTKQNDLGLTTQDIELNYFSELRQYFKELRENIPYSKAQIISDVGQCADHCLRWSSTQWGMPTESTYNKLCGLIEGDFKPVPFNELVAEYERLKDRDKYIFISQASHHSVWNYEIAERVDHVTPKPVELIKNIIRHSSLPGALVLDPFLGSGSTLRACRETGRRGLGFEICGDYESLIKRRSLANVRSISDNWGE